MTDMPHSIKYGIVCEDIRREENGKLIAIGIFAHDIRLAEVPSGLLLSFLIAIEAGGAGKETVEIALTLDDKEIGKAKGEISFDQAGLAIASLPRAPIPFRHEGKFVLKARLSDQVWHELWKGPVMLMNVAPSTTSATK